MPPKEKRDDGIWRLKKSVRERTIEEMNKLAKKAERQVWAKQKTNISDLKKKKERDSKPEINQNMERKQSKR